MNRLLAISNSATKISLKRRKIIRRTYHNDPDDVLRNFAMSGSIIGGFVGLCVGVKSNTLAGVIIFTGGGAFLGFAFVPSLAIPCFYPIYILVFITIYCLAHPR
jgi:hypothetical protein